MSLRTRIAVYVKCERETREKLHTLRFLGRANLFLHLECFAGVNDVDDCAGPRRLEIL